MSSLSYQALSIYANWCLLNQKKVAELRLGDKLQFIFSKKRVEHISPLTLFHWNSVTNTWYDEMNDMEEELSERYRIEYEDDEDYDDHLCEYIGEKLDKYPKITSKYFSKEITSYFDELNWGIAKVNELEEQIYKICFEICEETYDNVSICKSLDALIETLEVKQ